MPEDQRRYACCTVCASARRLYIRWSGNESSCSYCGHQTGYVEDGEMEPIQEFCCSDCARASGDVVTPSMPFEWGICRTCGLRTYYVMNYPDSNVCQNPQCLTSRSMTATQYALKRPRIGSWVSGEMESRLVLGSRDDAKVFDSLSDLMEFLSGKTWEFRIIPVKVRKYATVVEVGPVE